MKTYLNPDTLPRNPAFSQAIVVRDPATTIYVGGQNAIGPDAEITGDSIQEQVTQALANVERALAAADASIEDVVRWTISVIEGQDLRAAFGAFRERYPSLANPPTISVQVVAGLANPGFLVEIDAIAVQ
jgi:enamine deaminase RidA (YjgF/YER057c/UK114 family)